MPKLWRLAGLTLAFASLTACASSPNASRLECAANIGLAVTASEYAREAERTYNVDVDAYDSADQFAFWSNMALAGFNALSAGRSPNGDDACLVVNQTSDTIYSRSR